MSGFEEDILLSTKDYIETYFIIKSKERRLIPFILNDVQNDYIETRSYVGVRGKGQRDIVVKARQHGFTTLKAAEFLHDCMTNEGVESVIVGHDEDAMSKILDSVRLMYRSVPREDRPRLKYDNRGEIFFPDLNSRFYISTYRSLKLRSQMVTNILMTEVAFWKGKDVGDLVAGMTEGIPIDGNITLESTPKGIGGYFWKIVKDAKDGRGIYKLFMYPWFVNPEYRIPTEKWSLMPDSIRPKKDDYMIDKVEMTLIERWGVDIEQIMWRRYKMSSLGDMRISENGVRYSRRFSQEYECSFTQSGMPVFSSDYLHPSTKFEKPKKDGRYVHGVDTAEGIEGGDYNVMYTIDFETGEVVNKIRGLWKAKEFALRIHEECMKYGGLVGIENNNTGHAVLVKLIDFFEEDAIRLEEKAKINLQEAIDSKADEAKIKILREEADKDIYDRMPYRIYSEKGHFGWTTNGLSRKIMFIEGEEALREGLLKLSIDDEEGIEELMSCQYNDKMKEEAPAGMNDDSVLALLIGWQMRKYYQFYFTKSSGIVVTSH